LEQGELSTTERAALETWLNRDPVHRALLSGYGTFCANLDEQLMALLPNQLESFVDPEAPPATKIRAWRPMAALAAAAAIGFGLWIAWPQREFQSITTPPTHRQTIALADGTRADLNAQTRLRVDFSDRTRRLIQMEQGEALFTVAKDSARPFIVETPGGKVRVTGTVFNVRTTSTGNLDVTVLEGTVEVLPIATGVKVAAEPLQLTKGDQVTLDRTGSFTMARGEPEAAADATAWREGQVVFKGVPLADALERFAAFHGRTIKVAPEVAQLHVGGRYSLDDLDGFLSQIASALPVRVYRDPDLSVRVTAP
jgi:transmembrane sensor